MRIAFTRIALTPPAALNSKIPLPEISEVCQVKPSRPAASLYNNVAAFDKLAPLPRSTIRPEVPSVTYELVSPEFKINTLSLIAALVDATCVVCPSTLRLPVITTVPVNRPVPPLGSSVMVGDACIV